MAIDTYMSIIWQKLLLGAVVIVVVNTVYSVYKARSRVNRLRQMGLPMPPWSWLTGNLTFFRNELAKYPPDILISVVMKDIAQNYFAETEMFYLDLWPILPPTLWCGVAAASTEVDKRLTTKPDVYQRLFQPMCGGRSLLDTNGHEWKYWRGLMKPGFAPGYVMSKAHHFIESGDVYTRILEKKAEAGDVFQLEVIAMRFTLESIIKIALDWDMDHQQKFHPVVTALLAIMPWTTVGNPFEKLNPVRPIVIANYNRIINNHMIPQLEHRFTDYMSDPIGKQYDSIFTLMLSAHNKDLPSHESKPSTPQMDRAFKDNVLHQIRMLLVAGHDTTTSIMIYVHHMLHKNPAALEKMREEHSRVFGPDLSRTSALLHEKPALTNNLPYTLGIIKETMRLFPPGGAYRAGSPDVHLNDRNGTQYPTDGCHVSVAHHTLHYSPNVYTDPESFQPERWIDKGVELGGWRPFERGPRNCMGQDVAMLQMKVELVLTGRKFNISPAYEEWDKLEAVKTPGGRKWSIFKLLAGVERFEKKEINGDRAYQAENGGLRSALGYPCRVELANT